MNNLKLYKKPLNKVRPISNLKEMLVQSCTIFGEKPAFLVYSQEIENYMPVSYSQYGKDVNSLGTALLQSGLKGKRVAVIGENRYEWAVTYLAVVNGVGVIVPIDKELPENEIENLLIRSEAEAVIFSGKLQAVFDNIIQKVDSVKKYISMDLEDDKDNFYSYKKLVKEGEKLIEEGIKDYVDAVIDSEEMGMMLFTSGTTDSSKAVMLSHRNISSNIMDMGSMVLFTEKDVLLSVLPIHHTYECTGGFLLQIYSGSTIAFCQGLRHIVKNLQQSKATIMLTVPLIAENIYKRIWEQAAKEPGKMRKLKIAIALSNFLLMFGIDIRKRLFKPIHDMMGGSMSLLISGAAAIDPAVSKGYREFGILAIQGYGLTECSPLVAVNMVGYSKDASAGLPTPNVEVKIEDKNDEGIGEIVVRGPNIMIGYYNNEEATNNVLKDGWYYTGDLGYIDKNGFIYITGRKKYLIVTKNGKNIYPEELETLINRALFVKESMVYGKPDEDGDTLVCAEIVINREYLEEKCGDSLTEEMVNFIVGEEIKKINHSILPYKHIKQYSIREEEFQKTTTKKIKRYLETSK
ncbi:MAG: AMP-dependent synthetase/ligase [Deltaproteobacteria bacterium]